MHERKRQQQMSQRQRRLPLRRAIQDKLRNFAHFLCLLANRKISKLIFIKSKWPSAKAAKSEQKVTCPVIDRSTADPANAIELHGGVTSDLVAAIELSGALHLPRIYFLIPNHLSAQQVGLMREDIHRWRLKPRPGRRRSPP